MALIPSFNQPLLNFIQYLKKKPVSRLIHVQLGVWDVVIQQPAQRWLPTLTDEISLRSYVSSATLVGRFIQEIHGIAPRQFWKHVLNGIWEGMQTILTAYASDLVFTAVMDHLQHPDADVNRIYIAVAFQLGLTVMKDLVDHLVTRDEGILKERINFHFLSKTMAADLHREIDDGKFQGSSYSPFSPSPFKTKALQAFEDLSTLVTSVIRTTSQLLFTYHLLRHYPVDPFLILVNMIQPFTFTYRSSIYEEKYFTYSSNNHFKRMLALHKMASDDVHRTDIKSDGLQDYIIEGFQRDKEYVGDASTEGYAEQWHNTLPVSTVIIHDIMDSIPSLYFAIRLVLYPKSLTPSMYAQLQNAAGAIYSSVFSVALDRRFSLEFLGSIRDIYEEEAAEQARREREIQLLPYPQQNEKSLHSGMEIEFRNVSFSYPGSPIKALTDVSFVVNPGQLVAIVGVNGSGKSTITNLFNRLYDPTEGEILVDGLPIKSYRRADIRRSMAILRQDHILYPLSLRENIALGAPDRPCNDKDLKVALRDGGASGLVEKLPEELDTVLAPVSTVSTNMSLEDDDDDLAHLKAIDESEIHKDVSGGEEQRLAASRTFLRLRGGGIRFLAADEPTSALDPEGEFELFARLRQQRGGLTVVFVTHRFGHITRYADLILCMKDGYLVEKGTHDELIATGGDYHKLHRMQAQAFINELVDDDIDVGTEPIDDKEDTSSLY